MNKGKVIGMAGVARCGKDTAGFFTQEILYENKEEISKTCGFADLLKQDLDKLCRAQFGFSSFTSKKDQKELIRPLLVSYGTHVWRKANPNHWIEKMKPTVDFFTSAGRNVIITDVRYKNELEWIQTDLQGSVIYISRDETRAANAEEEQNCPLLKEKANELVQWESFGEKDIKKAKPHIEMALKNLNLI